MIRRLASRPFVRNVAILASGATTAQALAIAASPLLTRLFAPDAFGSFGLLISLSAVCLTVAGLRYELAVVTVKDDLAAANLLVLSCSLVVIVTGLTAVLAAIGGDYIADLLDRPDIAELLWWLPILTLVGGTHQAVIHWSTRRTHFKRIAVSRVLQSLAALGAQLAAGLASMGAGGLIGGRVLGSFMGTGNLVTRIWRDDRLLIQSAMNIPAIIKVAKENSQFPKYNMPHSLLNSLSKASVPFTLAPFFGVEIVGFFYLAERVMRTPSALVASSIKRVFYQRGSELHNQGRSFYRLLTKTFVGLFSIGIIPTILLLFFGPELFSVVFGSEWRQAGTLAQWLVIWWFIAFIARPVVDALTILTLQKYLLYFQIALSISRVVSILIGAMVGDQITAIAACSVVSAAFNFGLIVFALIVVRPGSKWSG